jgi:hypothetical protein
MPFIERWNVSKISLDIGQYSFIFFIGLSFTLFGIISYFYFKYIKLVDNYSFEKKNINLSYKSKLSVIIGVICLTVYFIVISILFLERNRLVNELNSPKIVTTEGLISVEFEQPYTGHTGGDIIRINNYTFDIDYFHATLYYHRTIAHGGFLTNGKYFKIYFIPSENKNTNNWKILKLYEKIVE